MINKVRKAIENIQQAKKYHDSRVIESVNSFVQTELPFKDGKWVVEDVEYTQTPHGVIKQILII
jgi:hypothetical protein